MTTFFAVVIGAFGMSQAGQQFEFFAAAQGKFLKIRLLTDISMKEQNIIFTNVQTKE